MRKVFIDHKRRICFFWSPKCASRSLTWWIFSELMGGDPEAVHWVSIGSMVKKVYRADFGTAKALVKRRGYMAVAFVRHPARRIVSAYINKLVAKGAALDELMPGALDAVTSIYRKSGRRLEADSFDGISLMELLDYVEDRAGLRIGALDGHWDMQVHESLLRSGRHWR